MFMAYPQRSAAVWNYRYDPNRLMPMNPPLARLRHRTDFIVSLGGNACAAYVDTEVSVTAALMPWAPLV